MSSASGNSGRRVRFVEKSYNSFDGTEYYQRWVVVLQQQGLLPTAGGALPVAGWPPHQHPHRPGPLPPPRPPQGPLQSSLPSALGVRSRAAVGYSAAGGACGFEGRGDELWRVCVCAGGTEGEVGTGRSAVLSAGAAERIRSASDQDGPKQCLAVALLRHWAGTGARLVLQGVEDKRNGAHSNH